MNKKVLFVIIGIILLIVGAFAYVALTPNNGTTVGQMTADLSKMQKPDTSPEETPQTDTPSTSVSTEAGLYREYSEDAIQSTSGTKLLFFHASWCSQCRSIEESIEKDGIPDGVTVFKIDYDSNQALRQKYGVTLQTTFVKIDDDGNKVASYVAYEEPQFSSVARELLQ